MTSACHSQSVHPRDGDDEEAEEEGIPEETTSRRLKSKPLKGGKQICAICKKESKCPSDHKYVLWRYLSET
jgi:hypothetical protein